MVFGIDDELIDWQIFSLTSIIKEKQYNKCFGIILVLLCMSVDVDILNSIPRSFGPGYAFITIGIIMMFYYDDWEIILGSFISGLGVVLSNTGICIFLPFFVIFVISKIKQLKRIFFSFLGGIPAIVINQLFVNFYIQNSEYKVWGQQGMIFENDKFVERVTSSINDYFKDMFFIRNGWIYIF